MVAVALTALAMVFLVFVAIPGAIREDKRDTEEPERWKDFL